MKKFLSVFDEAYIFVEYEEGTHLGTMEYTKYKEGDNTVVRMSQGPDGDIGCKVEFVFDSDGMFMEHRIERH